MKRGQRTFKTLLLPLDLHFESRSWRNVVADTIRQLPEARNHIKEVCVVVVSPIKRLAKYTWCKTHDEAEVAMFEIGDNSDAYCHTFEMEFL